MKTKKGLFNPKTQLQQRCCIIGFSWVAALCILGVAIGSGLVEFGKEFAYQFRTGWRIVTDAWNWKPTKYPPSHET